MENLKTLVKKEDSKVLSANLAATAKRAHEATDVQLQNLLNEAMFNSAFSFLEACIYLREMERRGKDVSFVPRELRGIMEKLADGQYLPELHFILMGKPNYMIDRISGYSLAQQQELLNAGVVRKVEMIKGQVDVRRIPLSELDRETFDQVLTPSHILDEAEQERRLRQRHENEALPAAQQCAKIVFLKKLKKVRLNTNPPIEITLGELREWTKVLVG